MIHNDVPSINKGLWRPKAPLKINIFLWYLRRGIVLAKDNLVQRNWHGSKQCCFFHKDETIKHLFFLVSFRSCCLVCYLDGFKLVSTA